MPRCGPTHLGRLDLAAGGSTASIFFSSNNEPGGPAGAYFHILFLPPDFHFASLRSLAASLAVCLDSLSSSIRDRAAKPFCLVIMDRVFVGLPPLRRFSHIALFGGGRAATFSSIAILPGIPERCAAKIVHRTVESSGFRDFCCDCSIAHAALLFTQSPGSVPRLTCKTTRPRRLPGAASVFHGICPASFFNRQSMSYPIARTPPHFAGISASGPFRCFRK